MALCYSCKEIFYGDQCNNCGWEISYKCWRCKTKITSENSYKHSSCGWFVCPSCEACGCEEERPMSNEEKMKEGGVW